MHIKGRLHGTLKVTTALDEWSFAGEERGRGACFLPLPAVEVLQQMHTSPFHSQGRREGMNKPALRDPTGNADVSFCANGSSWSLCTTWGHTAEGL